MHSLNDWLDGEESLTAFRHEVYRVIYGAPMTDRMLQFFQYQHLPVHLQEASKDFCELAEKIVEKYPQNPERTVTLRKLLEAKDACVRTLLYKE